MITSRKISFQGVKTLVAAMGFAGGLALATTAQASPLVTPVRDGPQAVVTPIQYWGGHGDWGHHRHHREDRGYGHHRRHFGWGHRDHGWGHHRGWERRHDHHHRHHDRGRFDY